MGGECASKQVDERASECMSKSHLGKHAGNIFYMRQSDQLDSRSRYGDRSIPQNAIQKPLLTVLGSVGTIYVKRLEHCVRQVF